MSKNHYPGANITAQYWAGKFVGSSMNTNCVCLHTTETSVWPGYGSGASAPHMTVLPNIKAKTISVRQHFPAGKSSRALVNLSGGVETNTLNVFQIELIGTCDSRYAVSRKEWGVAGVDYIYWPDAPDWLLEAIAPIFRWLDAEWPNFKIVDAAPRGWVKYPDSYGINARQRMTAAEWLNAYGIFGHQHVRENAHGDPGNFPIAKLIELATGNAPTPPVVPPTPKPKTAKWGQPETWVIGAVGPDVKRLGERIRVWSKHYGLPDPYKVGPDEPLTEVDVKGLSAVQVKFGYGSAPTDLAKGGTSDGYPGPLTFEKLASDPTAPSRILCTSTTQNLAGSNARGMVTGLARTRRYVAARKAIPVDIAHVQEATVASLVRPTLDSGLKGLMRRVGGGEGRYDYAGSRVKVIEAGMITVASKHWYKKDDKQASYTVGEIDGALTLEVGVHLEYRSGSTADIKRVQQMYDIINQAETIRVARGVPTANVMYCGDLNSLRMVIEALEQYRWVNAAVGGPFEHTPTFIGWDGKGTKRFDYFIVHETCPYAEVVAVSADPSIADHAGLRLVRELVPAV